MALEPLRYETHVVPGAGRSQGVVLQQLTPATLRKAERTGIVVPRRDPATGHRVYADGDAREPRR